MTECCFELQILSRRDQQFQRADMKVVTLQKYSLQGIENCEMNPQHDPNNPMNQPLLSKHKLRELTHLTCPGERFDPNIENIMIKIAEEFVAKVAHGSCDLARHRKSKVLEVEDVQLHLDRIWDLGIPGFLTTETRKTGKGTSGPSEGHMQRLNVVQKELGKH